MRALRKRGQRPSVERDIKEFCGWSFLLLAIEACERMPYAGDAGYYRRRDQGLCATLFELGGRITEILLCRKNMFEIREDVVVVHRMPLLKRYKKIEEILDIRSERPKGTRGRLYHWSHERDAWVRRKWITEPVFGTRGTFTVKRFEPLAPIMVDWIQRADDYLFPAGRRRKGGTPHMSRFRAWQIMKDIESVLRVMGHRIPGGALWDHWWRSQRASQLASEYGFRVEDLMKWFSWEDVKTAMRYAKLSPWDLDKLMRKDRIRLG